MSGDEYLFELGARSETTLDELSRRRSWLLPAALIALAANICVWLLALVFPQATANVYRLLTDNNLPRYGTLLTVLAMAIPFAPPFVAAFALLSLRDATHEPPAAASDVMASFHYSQTANRRWVTVVIAGICGGLNCLCLFIALLIRTGK